MIKKAIKIIILILLVILVAVGIYVGYVLFSWDRIPDKQAVKVEDGAKASEIQIGDEVTAVTYNIGFCAYLPDYSFFMDGGKESRAESRESVEKTLDGIVGFMSKRDADIYLVQEVDRHSTRSHQVDQKEAIVGAKQLSTYDSTYAVNYDSPYLMYPLTEPHGKNYAGILTLSKFDITQSIRRSLPIQTDVAKVFDLDRCYNVNRIKTSNGKELCLYNLHLSAYTTDETIADKQLDMLYDDMVSEYEKGNYIVAGGNFNKDLTGNSGEIFGISGKNYSWSKPFKKEELPEMLTLADSVDKENPVPSNRNANEPWDSETTFQNVLDGFIVSDNIKIIEAGVINLDFIYSDHNPVGISFMLVD